MLVALNTHLDCASAFADVRGRLVDHYAIEAELWQRFAEHHPQLAAKILSQHSEVRELSAHGDDLSLVRRFQALAQHNIIEEERDVYPVVARCFEF